MEDTDEHHDIYHAGPAVGPAADAGDAVQNVLMSSDPSSLLELLLLQRTGGETGVRLNFHRDLAHEITISMYPFHYCGLHGHSALAAYLYSRHVRMDRPLQVASFAANGTTDSSPWSKAITVSPQETALLAGHAETSAVLALCEDGVPLHWSRRNHGDFPDSFRQKVKPLMEALVSSPGFAALPGPARVAAVDIFISDMARSLVWGSVGSGSGAWGSTPQPAEEESEVWALAAMLPQKRRRRGGGEDSDSDEEDSDELPAYMFRMGLSNPGRTRRFLRLIGRATAGAAAMHVARSFGCSSLLPNAGFFVAGFIAPVPALLVLGSIKLHQRCTAD